MDEDLYNLSNDLASVIGEESTQTLFDYIARNHTEGQSAEDFAKNHEAEIEEIFDLSDVSLVERAAEAVIGE